MLLSGLSFVIKVISGSSNLRRFGQSIKRIVKEVEEKTIGKNFYDKRNLTVLVNIFFYYSTYISASPHTAEKKSRVT